MSRKKIPEQSLFPYHITARCNNKERFPLQLQDVWDIATEHLYFLHKAYGFEIHAFVLMNNHFHMLASTPLSNLSEGMQWFMKETSRHINQEACRVNQLWGGRFFRSMIVSRHYFFHAYKYIYRNPVQAALCEDVLSYRYSTLRGLLGFERSIVPICEVVLFENSIESCISWLNKTPLPENWRAVSGAMRRTVFQLPKCRKSNQPLNIENELL